MRKDNKSKVLIIRGLLCGADTSGFNAENAPDFVRKRAYQLFEMRGGEAGHELEDWPQAEQEIKTRLQIYPSAGLSRDGNGWWRFLAWTKHNLAVEASR